MGIGHLNVCVSLWSVIIILYFSLKLSIFQIFLLKSSDLSMVNPHISLNLWNQPIHGAILGFSKDFYCAIHRFCGQSSDLAVDLSKSSSRSEEYFIYFVWVSVLWLGQCDCLLHWQTICSTDRLRFADGVSES